MNKPGWLIVLFLSCGVCEGQNLVPNGDFEQYSTCPTNSAQLYLATPWINPATNIVGTSGTPDYYNSCNFTNVGVPNNWLGFQQAHSGFGYAGIYLYQLPYVDVREYLEVQLTSALIAEECYHFEMYVSLGNNCKYTNDDIGVYFSDTLVSGINNILPLPFIPQVNNTTANFPDTLNWLLVSGNYVATGTENYIIIGSFVNDSIAAPILVNNTGTLTSAITLIDDVSLTITPCTGINESNEETGINIYPNPFTDKLNIEVKRNELVEINLFDITSRKIFNQSFANSISINTSHLAKGIYIYEVRNKDGVIKKGKLVKNP